MNSNKYKILVFSFLASIILGNLNANNFESFLFDALNYSPQTDLSGKYTQKYQETIQELEKLINQLSPDALSDLLFNNDNAINLMLDNSFPLNLFKSLLKKFLDKNIDLNLATKIDLTFLMKAAAHRRYDIVRELIDAGADVNIETLTGRNALNFVFFKDLLVEYDNLESIYSINNIINDLIIAGSSINEKSLLEEISNFELFLNEQAQEKQSLLRMIPLYQDNFNNLRQTFTSINKLEQAFNAPKPFDEIKGDINQKGLELFIAREFNKDPYALDALTEYFKNINVLKVLETYKAYFKPGPYQVFEFIINLRNGGLSTNPNLLKAIVTGEKSEQFADTPVMKLYKLAQESENKKLGQIIRQWAENAYILSQEMRLKDDKDNEQYRQLPAELVSHITSYLKATD